MLSIKYFRNGIGVTVKAICLIGLAGCAHYEALPLTQHPSWKMDAMHLSVNRNTIPFPKLAKHSFDPTDGLDMTEVAMLAVANNPDLRLARDDAGIGHAQSYAAGLLPDLQLNLSRDVPTSKTQGLVTAYSFSPGYDLQSLLIHSTGHSAAESNSQQIDLNLLWQEWQIVAQARLLFSRAISQDQLLIWLRKNQQGLQAQYKRTQSGLASGDITADIANANLIAWQDVSRQVNDLERQQQQTRHDLNQLLGLSPDTKLTFNDHESLDMPTEAMVRQAMDDLPKRRPDLLALQAGYRAQDARYRQAILMQFPPLNVAANLARDTGGITTQGLAIATAIPLLNGNRGQIAVAKATRQRLHDEYENRVLSAQSAVSRLIEDSHLLAEQLATVRAGFPQLDAVAESSEQELDKGEVDGAAYVSIESSRISKHIEAINLQQSLLENRITLLSLLGVDDSTGSDTGVKP